MSKLFVKKCPCCHTGFNILNYHSKTRTLPIVEDPNYKCLKCLECNHRISSKVKTSFVYVRAALILFFSFVFAVLITNSFDFLKGIEHEIINIPFIVLFYLLVYLYDFTTVKLICNDNESNAQEKSITLSYGKIRGTNINGLFGEGDRQFGKKVLSFTSKFFLLFLIVSILILVLKFIV